MDPFDAQPTPPRRGRRDNGLGAERYVPLLDVDPRVGEHLLDVLRLAGVPAYLEPSVDLDPYTRATSIPSPPTDRLWVDRDRRDTAREIVTTETALGLDPDRGGRAGRSPGRPGEPEVAPSHGLADPVEERAWRDIIARYDLDPPGQTGRGGVPPWPVVEDVDRPDSLGEPPPERRGRPATGRGSREPSTPPADPRAGAAGRNRPGRHRSEPDPADAEEHYIPPVPPPLPRLSKQTIAALVLIVAGTVLLLWPRALGFSDQGGLALGVVCLVSAGAMLVLRLRADRYDDPDDGAVL